MGLGPTRFALRQAICPEKNQIDLLRMTEIFGIPAQDLLGRSQEDRLQGLFEPKFFHVLGLPDATKKSDVLLRVRTCRKRTNFFEKGNPELARGLARGAGHVGVEEAPRQTGTVLPVSSGASRATTDPRGGGRIPTCPYETRRRAAVPRRLPSAGPRLLRPEMSANGLDLGVSPTPESQSTSR